MTQQFNTFCFTVFTEGIIQAFIGNLLNLGHFAPWNWPSCWNHPLDVLKSKIVLPHPPPIWHGWKTSRINSFHEQIRSTKSANASLHQAYFWYRLLFIGKARLSLLIQWDYVCWLVIMYMIQYEGKPLGTKRSRKGNQFYNLSLTPW